MSGPSPEDPCPCGGAKPYGECCRPLHEGRPAPDAEALMRARFAAFRLGLCAYWWATLASRHVLVRRGRDAAIAAYERARHTITYRELLVIDQRASREGHEVLVKVRAAGDRGDASFVELAQCTREGGQWRYAGGITRPARALPTIPSFADVRPAE